MLKRSFVLLLSLYLSTQAAPSTPPPIKVNQLGYLKGMPKIAVFSAPKEGLFSQNETAAPGKIYLIDAKNSKKLTEIEPLQVNGGKIDPMSGDQVWRIDFSNIKKSGTYKLFDSKSKSYSASFPIGSEKDYQSLLRDAVKTFYYQRCGIAKTGYITDQACHPDRKSVV